MIRKSVFYYTTIPLVCLTIVGLSLFRFKSVSFGMVAGLASVTLLFLGGKSLVARGFYTKTLAASLSIFFASITILSALYMMMGFTPGILFFYHIALCGIAIVHKKREIVASPTRAAHTALRLELTDLLTLPILTGQLFLFLKLIEKATTIAIGSPWVLIGNRFFVLYALVTLFLLIYVSQSEKRWIPRGLIVLHYALSLSVAAIIYKLGFGYDPFLHRAAETVIAQAGSIEPRTPFYIGQYILVVGAHLLTHIPIKTIDIWLVPAIASIGIPFFALVGFKRGFGVDERLARVLALLIPLYPLSLFYATTPYNLATLFLFFVILLAPLIGRDRDTTKLGTLVAFSACLVHPLSGIFAVWFIVGASLAQRRNRFLQIGHVVIGALLIPLLFSLYYLFVLHVSLPPLSTIITNFHQFLGLFERPYYFIGRPAHWVIDLIYYWQLFIPIFFVLLALGALRYSKFNIQHSKLLLLFPAMLLVSMFLLATWLTHPDLSSFEQIQYAERLRYLVILFILPLGLAGLGGLYQKIQNSKLVLSKAEGFKIQNFVFTSFAFFTPLLLTASWYLTYPQRNHLVHFPGYNVTQADYDAVEEIKKESGGHSYIVLSNVLTAAAAIEKDGFSTYYTTPRGTVFFYSTPTGGPLYSFFSKMIYEGQKREYIDEAFALTDVDQIYFLVPDYWAKAPEIIAGAKKTADSWQSIDGGKIVLFRYDQRN